MVPFGGWIMPLSYREGTIAEQRAIIAVQGPGLRARLAPLLPEAAAVGRFRVVAFEWGATPCIAAGTGYTGEDGIEISVPAEAAEGLWQAIIDAGVPPAGL